MCHVNMLKRYHVRDGTKPLLNQNTVTSDTCNENENPGDDFVMNCDGCDIRLENAISNLRCHTLSQVSSVCILIVTMLFDGGGCNVGNPCIECTIDILKPIECTICDAVFQVKLKQCNIVPAKPIHCTVCGVKFPPNCVIQ